MADARLRVFQATVGTAALHQRSETSGCIIYSVTMTCTLPKEKELNQNEIYQLRLFPNRKAIFQLKYNYPSSFCNT